MQRSVSVQLSQKENDIIRQVKSSQVKSSQVKSSRIICSCKPVFLFHLIFKSTISIFLTCIGCNFLRRISVSINFPCFFVFYRTHAACDIVYFKIYYRKQYVRVLL